MSISALRAITMARPGIETRGQIVDSRATEERILREVGLVRRLYGRLPDVKSVERLVTLIGQSSLLRDLGLERLLPGKPRTPEDKKEPTLADRLNGLILPPFEVANHYGDFLDDLPRYIAESGVREGYIFDTSIKYDPDYRTQKIPYDPAVDLGATAVRRLLTETKIDARDIAGLYVACTTFNTADPPIGDRILTKLVRDKNLPKEHVESDVKRGKPGWFTKTIPEGCVGWVRLVDEIERDMELNSHHGQKNKYVIGVAVGANSIHLTGKNPHEIISYRDGAAAGLFIPKDDNSGPFIVGPKVKVIDAFASVGTIALD